MFDRCGFSPLKMHFEAWHEVRCSDFGTPGARHSFEILWMTALVVFAPCALHAAQNAFTWSMAGCMADPELLRNVHIAVESLRNSTDLLVKHVAMWIHTRLRFVPPLTATQMQEWYGTHPNY